MFERFTDDARHAIGLAQDEAHALGGETIGPEHLLLGLVEDGGVGVGGRALVSLGLSTDALRAAIARGPAERHQEEGHPPLTPAAKRVLEGAMREALRLGQNDIGTEHLALGLARGVDGPGARLLRELAIEPLAVRRYVLELLARPDVARADRAGVTRRTVSIQLSPKAQEMLVWSARQALQLGIAYAGKRSVPLGLLRGADKATRELRLLPTDVSAAPPAGPVALPPGIAAARCSFCATPSPDCGTLFTGVGGALICQRCVARAAEGPPSEPSG